ncbi:hypothetical protein L1283_005198 [Sphingobacterium sp. HSC-15S19]
MKTADEKYCVECGKLINIKAEVWRKTAYILRQPTLSATK